MPDPAPDATPLRAAIAVAERFGIRTTDPAVLSDGANLIVHLAQAPIVARVATLTAAVRPRIRQSFTQEIALASYLRDEGVPVVAPASDLPPGPHSESGWTISFWDHVPAPADDAAIDVASFGTMLRDLHEVLRRYAGPVEPFGTGAPPLGDIEIYLRQVETGERPGSAVTADDIALIRADLADLLARPPDPVQPLHGDAHPGNLIAGPKGFVWSDFEESCRGPVAWDLASFARTRRFDPAPALAAYGHIPDLTVALRLRALHGLIWWAVFAEADPKHRGILDERLAELRHR